MAVLWFLSAGSSLEDAIKKGGFAYKTGGSCVNRWKRLPVQRLMLQYYRLQMKNHRGPVQQFNTQIPKMEDEQSYAEQWNEIRLQLAALMKNDIYERYIQKKMCWNKPASPEQTDWIMGEQSYPATGRKPITTVITDASLRLMDWSV